MRLGFAGTPHFALPALDALADSRHSIAAVFTQPDRPAGRGQTLHVSAVKQRAIELGIDVHQPVSFKSEDTLTLLSGLGLDALIVIAYGLILPAAALAVPRFGCINIHASLLPRWRGAAPIQRALLAGDAVTGVTIMRMEASLDTGPMLAIRKVPIADLDTAQTLQDRLARIGAELIVDVLEAFAGGRVRETPQPSTGISYAQKISKSEALIDWNDAAIGVLRRVRAFNPWPVAATLLNGVQLRVWEAALAPHEPAVRQPVLGAPDITPAPGSVIGVSNAGIDVACGRGALRIVRLQLAGRRPLAAGEFIKGLNLAGARFANS